MQASVDRIVSSMRGLWGQAMEMLRQQLEPPLSDTNDEPFLNTCIFDGLETQYLQHKYYKENFSYVVSCMHTIPSINVLLHIAFLISHRKNVCWVVTLLKRVGSQWKLWIAVTIYPCMTLYKLCLEWKLFGMR